MSFAPLHANSGPVKFVEVQGAIERLLQMLDCEFLKAVASDEVGFRPPLEPASEVAWFPNIVSTSPSKDENLTVYRLIAAQHAGRRLCGSLEFDLKRFLSQFTVTALAEQFFLVFDGFRVDATLARAYRGLASDLSWLSGQEQPKGEHALVGTVEHLMARVIRMRPTCLAVVREWLARLSRREATVLTSARATAALYLALQARGKCKAAGASDLITSHGEAGSRFEPLPVSDGDGGKIGLETNPDAASLEAAAGEELAHGEGMETDLSRFSLEELLDLLEKLGNKTANAQSKAGSSLDIFGGAGSSGMESKAEPPALHATRPAKPGSLRGQRTSGAFLYDEWDYELGGYRPLWCTLSELSLNSRDESFFANTVRKYRRLLDEVRLHFQQIKPEGYRTVKKLEEGEDFDLNALVDARADRRAGHAPTHKLYVARRPQARDLATLFLLDMSASTDERVSCPQAEHRRIIDINKEALVVMSEALERIGDGYAIYGFSGHSRHQVEFYVIKRFDERLSPAVKGRIGAIEPKRSTRMGAALRHAIGRMRTLPARSKHMILLSDGFPQDVDYGSNRRSNTYGLQDTMKALVEATREGISTFCVTVDKAGHDYLKEMCDPSRYLVIEDVASLPRQLPKIYRSFTHS